MARELKAWWRNFPWPGESFKYIDFGACDSKSFALRYFELDGRTLVGSVALTVSGVCEVCVAAAVPRSSYDDQHITQQVRLVSEPTLVTNEVFPDPLGPATRNVGVMVFAPALYRK